MRARLTHDLSAALVALEELPTGASLKIELLELDRGINKGLVT